tara:strand:- start:640 stop:915 length:276 start_codon:yes stop_codon:yes gene_type:complete
MPKILDRLVQQLKDKGLSEDKAWATAVKTLRKGGSLRKDGKLTQKGKQRQVMGAAGRAKDRASKYSGGKHAPSDYVYNSVTNRATLAKKGS